MGFVSDILGIPKPEKPKDIPEAPPSDISPFRSDQVKQARLRQAQAGDARKANRAPDLTVPGGPVRTGVVIG